VSFEQFLLRILSRAGLAVLGLVVSQLPPQALHLNLDNNSLTSYHASEGNHRRIDFKALILLTEPLYGSKVSLEEKKTWPRLLELTLEPPIPAWR
jgi:hypothetical protein